MTLEREILMKLGAFAETSAAAVPQLSCCRAAKAFVLSLRQPHNKFRTGLEKGLTKLEYGSVKKVEVPASTFR